MLQLAKVGLVIVIIASVASIVITPDPSDDVDGVLQRHHPVRVTAVPISTSQSQSVLHITLWFAPLAVHRSAQVKLLDLVCVRLC